ncbi:MAG: CHASE2 domain-containing protein [Acidobacteriota bacterium]
MKFFSVRRWMPLVILFLLNLYLQYRGAYEPVALATYDWFQVFMRTKAPSPELLVTVFTMGGSTQSAIAGNSVDEESRILELINIISCAHPRVIGIDWRSGNWKTERLASLQNGPASKVPIVWARERTDNGELLRVAGGVRLPELWTTGVAEVNPDADRAVRRHERWLPDQTDTFSWSLANRFCNSGGKAIGCAAVMACIDRKCDRESLLDYTRGADRVDQLDSDSLPRMASGQPVTCDKLPWTDQTPNPFIKDRVVLIGDGSTADLIETPFGRKPGVMVMAHSIQADLMGTELREPSHLLTYVFDLTSIVVVIGIHKLHKPFLVLFLNLVGIPSAAVAFSYGAFASWHHWFNFIPLLGGVALHQQYEQAVEGKKFREEFAKTKAELEECRKKLG